MSEDSGRFPGESHDLCGDGERAAAPEGWNSLDVPATEAEAVEGLLSNGAIVHAEWWGPVPEDMYVPGEWDGSGWGWGFEGGGLPEFGCGLSLVAWRPK